MFERNIYIIRALLVRILQIINDRKTTESIIKEKTSKGEYFKMTKFEHPNNVIRAECVSYLQFSHYNVLILFYFNFLYRIKRSGEKSIVTGFSRFTLSPNYKSQSKKEIL